MLEIIGTLTGGVAHDFNNLLTVILGNAEFGLQDSNPEEPVYEDLMRILEAANQAKELTSQLLSFSRKQVLNIRQLDINQIILNLVKMLKRVIKENINVTTNLFPDLNFRTVQVNQPLHVTRKVQLMEVHDDFFYNLLV